MGVENDCEWPHFCCEHLSRQLIDCSEHLVSKEQKRREKRKQKSERRMEKAERMKQRSAERPAGGSRLRRAGTKSKFSPVSFAAQQ